MTLDGHDGYIWYTLEDTNYGTPDNDQTWLRLPEVENVSGRGSMQEVKDIRRHGLRKRAGSPSGKREEDDLVFDVILTNDSQTNNVYDTFLKSIFDSAFDSIAVNTKSYTFLICDDPTPVNNDQFEYYYGCILNEVELVIAEGEPIKATLTFMRRNSLITITEQHVSGGNVYTAYPTIGAYLLWTQVTVTKKTGTGWTNGSDKELDFLSEISLSVNQGGEKKFRLDQSDLCKGIHFGGFEVTGSMTLDHDDGEEAEEVELQTWGDLEIAINDGAPAGTITLTNVSYEGYPFDSSVNSLITVDIDLVADEVAFGE